MAQNGFADYTHDTPVCGCYGMEATALEMRCNDPIVHGQSSHASGKINNGIAPERVRWTLIPHVFLE